MRDVWKAVGWSHLSPYLVVGFEQERVAVEVNQPIADRLNATRLRMMNSIPLWANLRTLLNAEAIKAFIIEL